MPNLGERKSLDLSGAKNKTRKSGGAEQQGKRGSPAPPPAKPKQNANKLPQSGSHGRSVDPEDEEDEEDDEEDEDEDEIITSSMRNGGGNSKLLFAVGAVVVVLIVVVGFVLFKGRGGKEPDPGLQQPVQTEPSGSEPNPEPGTIGTDPSLGTQDFTQDTNNKSDSPMTDPDQFTKDIYGLTTRVDYSVAQIQEAADFVSYEKHRGTWGGGLELYYLDAVYKGTKYVVQVPFKYYKELDDVGIIPVKMEVLRIKNETGDGYLTVVSYMCLDEETLKAVLKTQSKS